LRKLPCVAYSLGRDPSLALGMTALPFRDKSAYGGSMARASG